jgi:cellulose synthase/poly-beta-1,6-N-acetylglucosamine synthase-like glycosyltransferase
MFPAITLLAILFTGFLGLYTLNAVALALLAAAALKRKKWEDQSPLPDILPVVTVQIPIYNEEQPFIEAVLGNVTGLTYPKDRLEIQILDDSTDMGTVNTERELARKYREDGYSVALIHRDSRQGYKAGALNNGLRTAKGEYVVIVDADTHMPASFLQDTLRCFTMDERLAFVQTRCDYTDRWLNWVTESVAVERDIHHLVEQPAKDRYSLLPNFSGKAGIWRRKVVQEYAWDETVLTEDIELSYRVQIDGWRSRYLSSPACLIEIPPTLEALRSQQRRWTAGFAQSLRKLWRPLLHSKELGLGQKLEALIYLSSPLTHLAVPAAIILWTMAAILEPAATLQLWLESYAFSLFMLIISVAPNLSVIMGVLLSDSRRVRKLLVIPLTITLGSTNLVANAKGALEGLFRENLVFHRTVKYGGNIDLAQSVSTAPRISLALRRNCLELVGGALLAAAGAHLLLLGQLTSVIPLSYIAISWWLGLIHR